MHDNPYRAEAEEAIERGAPPLARRLISTTLLTIGAVFAIPGMLVFAAGIYHVLFRRALRITNEDMEALAFVFLAFVAVPVLFIVIGWRMRRSRRRNPRDWPR